MFESTYNMYVDTENVGISHTCGTATYAALRADLLHSQVVPFLEIQFSPRESIVVSSAQAAKN